MSYYRQPITTEVNNWDLLSRMLFCELMLHAVNKKDGDKFSFWHGNKYHQVSLERGQSIIAVDRFARELKINATRVHICLNQLIKKGIKLQIKRMPFGLVVTIQNYNELVKMKNQKANQSENQRQIKDQASNQSDKRDVELDSKLDVESFVKAFEAEHFKKGVLQ